MKSPLKNSSAHVASIGELKKLIPAGNVVNSFFFYCGTMEFALASTDRFVIGHTNNVAVHEFWESLLQNAPLVHEMVISGPFAKLHDGRLLAYLQDTWPTYKDPYVRAALFYTLNQYSTTGRISSGVIDKKAQWYTERYLRRLLQFKISNFHLEALGESPRRPPVRASPSVRANYDIYNLGHYRHNLLETAPLMGIEDSPIDHKEIYRLFTGGGASSTILLYKNHNEVRRLYKDYPFRMIDKYGNPTLRSQNCEEIIVTNF